MTSPKPLWHPSAWLVGLSVTTVATTHAVADSQSPVPVEVEMRAPVDSSQPPTA